MTVTRRIVSPLVMAAALVATAPPAVATGGVPARAASTTPSCRVTAQITPGSTGEDVACLQYLLAVSGLYRGELTGSYDDATTAAVTAYQAFHPPLPTTGVADVDTLGEMGMYERPEIAAVAADACTSDADLPVGATSPDVGCIQRHLAALQLFTDPVDETLGATTVAALGAFQAKNPALDQDGLPDPQTLAALGIWSGHRFEDATAVAIPAAPASPVVSGPWPAPQRTDYPLWNLTAQGIPFYGRSTPCSLDDANIIATEFAINHADIATQQWAVYVASREGGCDFRSVNYNLATRDDSHCTFQLNALAGFFEPGGSLGRLGWTAANVTESMQNCARAASDLWIYCGKGPWTKPYACLQPWENDLGPYGDQ